MKQLEIWKMTECLLDGIKEFLRVFACKNDIVILLKGCPF